MYYQNGNYMQDLNYYNQTPNFGYNPYMANQFQSQSMNMGNGTQMQMQSQNLNAMYPAVHRIISPVANQVLANCNTSYLTEDTLNNMVDTVYNIVEGDINVESCPAQTTQSTPTETQSSNCDRNSTRPTSTAATNDPVSVRVPRRQNSLLRDLIRIMLLNEIISRRNRNQSMMMPNNMPMNQQMFL